jgi:hypothetical protein
LRRLLAICCAAILATLIGCQTTPTGSQFSQGTQAQAQDDEGLSEEKQRELAEIKEMLKQLGPDVSSDLASLKEMVERQQQQQRAAAGPPDIVEDLWPAQRALADAIENAQ